jgi:hypothetical protein
MRGIMRTQTVVFVAVILTACTAGAVRAKKKTKPGEPPVAAPIQVPEGQIRQTLTELAQPGTDPKAVEALRPQHADFVAVFDPLTVAKVESYYTTVWSKDAVIAPKPDQTELRLYHATTDELLTGAPASKMFPLGWRTAAKSVKKGLVFFSWKYAKPGEEAGTLYDGLISVNGHWVWFPKIWNAVK